MFDHHINKRLSDNEQHHLSRVRRLVQHLSATEIQIDGKNYLNFASNDYLAIAADNKFLPTNLPGSCGSPLVTGYQNEHQLLEQTILEWVDAPDNFGCLLFSSGFAANQGLISALFAGCDGNALLIQDKLNHASLVESGRTVQALALCKQKRFLHNQTDDLSRILSKHSSQELAKLVVSEGVFSMDGDRAPVSEMWQVCQQHNAWLVVDDAHGIGISGERGQGSLGLNNMSLTEGIILTIPFGKALGGQGAAVVAHESVINYLVNFCKEYIYSTHISPMQAQVMINNIQAVQQDNWRREQLTQNINYFRAQISELNYTLMDSDSAIQPILVGVEQAALQLQDHLRNSGIWANAMRYPTVKKNQARIRITLNCRHTKADIDRLANTLREF